MAPACGRRPSRRRPTAPRGAPPPEVGLLSECPAGAGPHRGGLLLRWPEDGTVMAVSMTGQLAEVRRLVLVLATNPEPVSPGG